MSLEQIGFYTLNDARAHQASAISPLWRCELLLTGRCNFRCPYCRGTDCADLSRGEAERIVEAWLAHGLKNVRFSGGEPLLWSGLEGLVERCAKNGVERIAVSSNGSMGWSAYERLTALGVNDWSISLDACCATTGDAMAGNIDGAWRKVVANIERLARRTYVTVGVVLTKENVDEMHKTVAFAHGLGVADIRIISAAQDDSMRLGVEKIPADILSAHPILRYRVENLKRGRGVRGLLDSDSNRCSLVLDDMAALSGQHFPCIIYLREGGAPIGRVGAEMRGDRARWAAEHDTHTDPICRRNCLDVCVDYNNCAARRSVSQHEEEPP